MNNNGAESFVSSRVRDDNKTTPETEILKLTNQRCMDDIMACSSPDSKSPIKLSLLKTAENETSAKPESSAKGDDAEKAEAKPERKDIEKQLFDEKAPISHFSKVDESVFRSGRPRGAEGVDQALNKIWGDNQFDPEHAKHTTIIDLRGPAPAKYYQADLDEKNAESKASSERGITRENFPMQSKEIQDPQYVQKIVDYIDSQKADGGRVLVHCYHGTDRTGLVTAAYQLTHDPELKQLLKDNPEEAFQRGLDGMIEQGFTPKNYREMTQSLKDYVQWKSKQLRQGSDLTNDLNRNSQQYIEFTPLWNKAA